MASQLKENSVLHSPILLMLVVLLSSARNLQRIIATKTFANLSSHLLIS